MKPFTPCVNGVNGDATTTSITLAGTQSAEVAMPDSAQQVRVSFSGTSLALRFMPRGGSVPAVDATKSFTMLAAGVEILTIPVIAGALASMVASGSGTVHLTPGVGER